MVLLRYLRNHFKPEIYGYGYAGLFRQGMIENPTITVSLIVCPVTWIGVYAVTYYKTKVGDHGKKRYLYRYFVYRHDDERLDWLTLSPKTEAVRQEVRAKMTQESGTAGK